MEPDGVGPADNATPVGPFGSDERATYVPDPCPHCGGPTAVGWLDVQTRRSGPQWLPGLRECAAHCQMPADVVAIRGPGES